MRIHATFIQFKSDPGVIELVHAWDEDSVDNNPDGYAQTLEKELASYGSDVGASARVLIDVDRATIERALNPTTRVTGTVVETG